MGMREQAPVVGVVAAGGVLGASARYAATLLWPTAPGTFPWTVFAVNATGCALLGLLMVLATEAPAAPHPLLRPFLGTGFCGGFTTFSTYALDTRRLFGAGSPAEAVLYLGGTLVTALVAVTAGVAAGRALWVRREPA
ncbi:fluoride efflux transporter CrcB [Streptomyces griseus]|uniref:fluoride efflux transporter CrcB n=1 Tax=Streptomyces griseus TaxID=1911 RepID=UPI0005637A10|nr:fluoride efflux transporter CrcB [Streptomyces griseus]